LLETEGGIKVDEFVDVAIVLLVVDLYGIAEAQVGMENVSILELDHS
jgi:hypothetical protein